MEFFVDFVCASHWSMVILDFTMGYQIRNNCAVNNNHCTIWCFSITYIVVHPMTKSIGEIRVDWTLHDINSTPNVFMIDQFLSRRNGTHLSKPCDSVKRPQLILTNRKINILCLTREQDHSSKMLNNLVLKNMF